MPLSCLIIEDDPDTRDALTLLLSRWGYTTQSAVTRDDAMSVLKYGVPAVILLDVFMQGCPVHPFLQAVSALNPRPRIIVMTAAHAELEKWRQSVNACLRKPVDPDELRQCLMLLTPESADSLKSCQ